MEATAASAETPNDITSEVREITPGYARMILGNCRYPRQRPLRQSKVTTYANEMRAGRFKMGTIEMAKPVGGPLQLTDGQHRLAAVIECGITQEGVIATYYVDGQEAVDRSYSRTDIGLGRSVWDALIALGIDAELGLESGKDMRAVSGAVRLIRTRFNWRSQPISREDLAATASEFALAARQYFATIANGAGYMYSPLRRAPVTAIALLTFEGVVGDIGLSLTTEFWRGVAHDDGLGRGDPRKHLIDHLRNYNLMSMTGTGRKVSARYQSMYAAICWNYWCASKLDIQRVMVKDESATLILKHTRFAK